MAQDTLISLVVILKILIPASPNALNILAAIPGFEIIPTPTIEILAISVVTKISRAHILVAMAWVTVLAFSSYSC